MTRAGITLDDLNGALERTKVPTRQTLFDQYSQDNPQHRQYIDRFKMKLDQIAQADQKLRNVYSDPNSGMKIDNPLARERAIGGFKSVQQADLSATGKLAEMSTNQINKMVDDALKSYKRLTGATTAKSKSSKKVKDSYDKAMEYAMQAGITDPKAVELFLQSPAKYQQYHLRNVQKAGGTGNVQFSPDDVKKDIAVWESEYKGGTGKKAKTSALEELLSD